MILVSNTTTKLAQTLLGLSLLYCLWQAVATFALTHYPHSQLQGRSSRSLILPQTLAASHTDPSFTIDINPLEQATLFDKPDPSSEQKDALTDSSQSYLSYLEQARQKRQEQEQTIDQYLIDGIVWSPSEAPLVILKDKESERRLYLKEKATLKDWTIFSIHKTKVQFRLIDDPSVIHTLHLIQATSQETAA